VLSGTAAAAVVVVDMGGSGSAREGGVEEGCLL